MRKTKTLIGLLRCPHMRESTFSHLMGNLSAKRSTGRHGHHKKLVPKPVTEALEGHRGHFVSKIQNNIVRMV